MHKLAPQSIFATRYRIECVIAEGGFGIVYQAIDLRSGEHVALKLLKFDRTNGYTPSTRGRFEREIGVLRRLRSPSTVALLDDGITADGVLYSTFELLQGRDLRAALSDGPLPANIVRHILLQLLAALDEAHRLQLLHRDIKPENVRITPKGNDPWRVKLLDFGLAKSADGAYFPTLTNTGELVGTPRYMSPEQLFGRDLTPASDVYSLGILTYEMLVGSDALGGTGLADQFERLMSGYLPALPVATTPEAAELLALIPRMIAKEPKDRLRTAAAVLALLQTSPRETAQEPQRRGTQTVGAIVAAIVVIAALVFVGLRSAPEPASPPNIKRESTPFQARPEPRPQIIPNPVPTAAQPGGSSGCGQAPPFLGTGKLRFAIGEAWTTYIPSSYNQRSAMPLVVLLHGQSHTGQEFLEQSGFVELAERDGFIIVAPTDSVLPLYKPWEEPDDVSRVYEIQDETALQLCIDRDRVYAVGQEFGTNLIDNIACSDWLAAAAQNSSARFKIDTFCKRSSVPLIRIAPTQSKSLPLAGGKNCNDNTKNPYAKLKKEAEAHHGCKGPEQVFFSDPNGECARRECDIPLVLCLVDGGIPWPGTGPNDPNCPEEPPDFPTAEVVWSFLKEQVRKPVERRDAAE